MEFSLKGKLQTALQLIKTDVALQGAGLAAEQKANIQAPVSFRNRANLDQ